jgi:thymidylate synthase (FAD)
MRVNLISYTTPSADLQLKGIKTAEDLIVHNARVSNPKNQFNSETGDKLIKYCVNHGHWSIFEQAMLTVEIETSRAIAAQIIRHRSFTFQEFSQRYATIQGFEKIELRKQSESNRQSSTDIITDLETEKIVQNAINYSYNTYKQLLDSGVAREVARMVLPLSTTTNMYMTGTCRSFIHYIDLRTKQDTQKEHRLIAEEIKEIFKSQFPLTAASLNY